MCICRATSIRCVIVDAFRSLPKSLAVGPHWILRGPGISEQHRTVVPQTAGHRRALLRWSLPMFPGFAEFVRRTASLIHCRAAASGSRYFPAAIRQSSDPSAAPSVQMQNDFPTWIQPGSVARATAEIITDNTLQNTSPATSHGKMLNPLVFAKSPKNRKQFSSLQWIFLGRTRQIRRNRRAELRMCSGSAGRFPTGRPS